MTRSNFFGSINVGQNYSQEAREHSVLSDDQIRRIAPTVFAPTKHESRSERYVHIPTFDVIAGLREQGFLPVHVTCAKARKDSKVGHEKHIMRFRHTSQLVDTAARADWRTAEWYEVIVGNAHDGTSGYFMCGGWFRRVCLNGMAHGDKACEIRVAHKGKDCLKRVVDGAFQVLEMKDRVVAERDLMAETVLDEDEQKAYAIGMTSIRYAQSHVAQGVLPPVNPERVLSVRRPEDEGNDLWSLFNRSQEWLTQGGLRTNDPTRRSFTRGITGTADLLANRAMWLFSQQVAQKKAA